MNLFSMIGIPARTCLRMKYIFNQQFNSKFSKLKGSATQGENIADNGGIKESFRVIFL